MGSPFTATSVSKYNSNPPSDDGAQTAANRVQWSTQKSKLADPIKTAFDTSESATAAAFGKVVGGAGETTTAVDYTVTASDQGKLVKCTVSGKTITTPDATVVGAPFVFGLVNTSIRNITFAGNGTQTIDGSASFVIPAGCGCLVNTDGSNWNTYGQNWNNASGILNFLSGLTLSTAGGSGTFGIDVGSANDSTNAKLMRLASAYTKTTASWVVGTGNGGLDTGAIANSTWYHVYLIQRVDTGVVDVLFSLSATSPTLPANYTLFRRIGSMLTNLSAQWVLFTQTGDNFIWSASVTDVNNIATVATRVSKVLTVPTGVVVAAMFRVTNPASGVNAGMIFTSLQESDQAPSNSTGLADLITGASGSGGQNVAGNFARLTDTSAQIGVRATGTANTYSIFTYGWIDSRGR